MARDFFPNLQWEENFPKMDLQITSQQEILIDSMFKYSLLNYVNFETHKCGNTLDLILTNDTNLVSKVRSDIN